MFQNSPKTNDFSSSIKSCPCCGGSGSLVIKNAYDLTFEAVEVCDECRGTGYVALVQPAEKIFN